MTEEANVSLDFLRRQLADERSRTGGLPPGSGSGTYDSMDVDAKVAAAEARTDTKFARFESKLDQLVTEVALSRSEGKSNRNIIITTMIASVFAMAGIAVSIVAYGAAQFYNGTVVFDHRTPQASPPK